jgi:hypothetical protein
MKKAGFSALALGLTAPLLIGASSCSSNGGSSGKRSEAPQVEFIVTGSAPNGVDITYGDDTSNYQARSLPLDVTWSIKKNVLYWVMAQLQGGGRITCKVIIGTGVRGGHAVGGYNTCTAQSPSDPLGGWN